MKILIATETIAGKGHEKAAKVLKNVISANSYDEVKIVCLLKVFNRFLESLIRNIYITMIKRFPYLWQIMYKKESKFGLLFKDLIANVMYIKLKSYFDKEQPDLVIATHAAGLGVLAKYKKSHDYLLAAVFTDFQVNSFWVYDEIDYYFVAAEEFKQKLLAYGIEENKVYITGIPIDPIFFQNYGTKNDLGVDKQNYLKLLIMGGGLGLGGIKEVITALNQLDDVLIDVSVIAGNNTKLYNELNKLKSKVKYPFRVYSYVEDIYNKMVDSDLLISKPGGLTVSEALSVQIPILIYKPLPGQEEHNLKYLIKNKAAIRINNVNELQYWIKYINKNPRLCLRLKEREQLIAKPNSSTAIVEILINKEAQEEKGKVIQK